MKSLVIYDSLYGNTEMIANAIGITLSCNVVRINSTSAKELQTLDLLIVGSPTHGGRPTPALDTFLKNLPKHALENVKVTAFDTRFAPEEHGLGLRILMNIIHFAAGKIAKILVNKGGKLILEPEGFIVEDKKGPLKKGELERAKKWARQIIL